MNLSTAVESKKIKLNNYARYIEVFLGEGQSLMQFSPDIPCILNDPNTDLINFYRYINEPSLKEELNAFAENWELIGKFATLCNGEILMAYQDLSTEIISTEDVGFMIRAIVMMNMNHEEFSPLFEQKFVVSLDMFTNGLIKPIVNSLLKLKGDTVSENFKHDIETAFRSGFYEHFKNLINWQKTDLIDCISLSKHFACWLFIKEFGKSHHLHYDQNGNLKTHYGGEDYNQKSFYLKLKQVNNPAFITKIKNAKLFNTNPIDFIQHANASKNDIVLINLTDANLVMANGKNYSGFTNQLNQIKQIVKLNLNFLIIIDNKEIATDLVQFSEGYLRLTEYPEGYYLSTFDLSFS